MRIWELIFPTSHTALKICSIMPYWETSTYVHTTFTFEKTIFSEVNRDLLNFTCGNSSKDTKWKLQIRLFILRFWDSVSHSSSAAPLFEQTFLVNQRTLKFTCSLCVCQAKIPWPHFMSAASSNSICARWQLASNPKCRICKWLCELELPFSATAQMLHKRTIWSPAVRDSSRDWEQARLFWFYVHKPRQPGGFQRLSDIWTETHWHT